MTLGCGVTKGMIDETSLSVCLGEETTDVVQRLTDTAASSGEDAGFTQ